MEENKTELTFRDIELHEKLQEALGFMGFEKPTPIQSEAIPKILKGKDLIACAQTGTGKTAAFLLPILDKLTRREEDSGKVNTLVIAPTRELAHQIDQQVEGFAYFLGVSSLPVYGGGKSDTWDQQKKALTQGADIIIATPGRLIAHLKLGYVDLSQLEHLILDEADRMLDMGFYDDIMTIVSRLPKNRQTLMFSATMPPNIRKMARSILKDPDSISLAISKPAEGVLQCAYLTYDHQKVDLIEHLLTGKDKYPSVIIFTSTKRAARQINERLSRKGFSSQAISSDLEQKDREEALRKFKNKETQIIVATDILARGIDIKEISLVINYDVPHDAEDYVHRIGRTARADATGVAITFISDQDQHRFHRIEQLIEMEIAKSKIPPVIGEGPEYNPRKRRSSGRRGGGGRGRSGGGQNRYRGGHRKNSGNQNRNSGKGGGGNKQKNSAGPKKSRINKP